MLCRREVVFHFEFESPTRSYAISINSNSAGGSSPPRPQYRDFGRGMCPPHLRVVPPRLNPTSSSCHPLVFHLRFINILILLHSYHLSPRPSSTFYNCYDFIQHDISAGRQAHSVGGHWGQVGRKLDTRYHPDCQWEPS